MEPRYLLDTDTCIYIYKNKPLAVSERFGKLPDGEAAISVITFGELLFGAMKSAKRVEVLATLAELKRALPVLPLGEAAAGVYGELRADLESRGNLIGNNDLWIAAHSLSANLILVTNNEREFSRVRGLKLQNWTV